MRMIDKGMRRSEFSRIVSLRGLRAARYNNGLRLAHLRSEILEECDGLRRWLTFGSVVSGIISSFVSMFARFAVLRRGFLLLRMLFRGGK